MFLTDIRCMRIGENEMERIKTKDRILLAALDLFSEKGYDQTSQGRLSETSWIHNEGSADTKGQKILYKGAV